MNNVARDKRRANTKDKPQIPPRERPLTRNFQRTRSSNVGGPSGTQGTVNAAVKKENESEAQTSPGVAQGRKKRGAPTSNVSGQRIPKRTRRTVGLPTNTSESGADSSTESGADSSANSKTIRDIDFAMIKDIRSPALEAIEASQRNLGIPPTEPATTEHYQKFVEVLDSGKIITRCSVTSCTENHEKFCRWQSYCYDKESCRFAHIDWLPRLITVFHRLTSDLIQINESISVDCLGL